MQAESIAKCDPNYLDFEKRKLAYDMPPEKLKAISTRDLLLACLDYPFNFGTRNIMIAAKSSTAVLYNEPDYDPQVPDYGPQSFNGYQELIRRKDMVKELKRYYSSEDLTDTTNSMRNMYFGSFLLHDTIFNQLSRQDRKYFAKITLQRIKMYCSKPHIYNSFNSPPGLPFLDKILWVYDYERYMSMTPAQRDSVTEQRRKATATKDSIVELLLKGTFNDSLYREKHKDFKTGASPPAKYGDRGYDIVIKHAEDYLNEP